MEGRKKSVSAIKIKSIRRQKQVQDVAQAGFSLTQSKIRWPGGKVAGKDVREELLLQPAPAVPTAISRFVYYGIKSSFHVCDEDLWKMAQEHVSKQVKKKNMVDSLSLSGMYATLLGKQVSGSSTSPKEPNNKKRDTTVTMNSDGAIMLRLKHRCLVAPQVTITVDRMTDEQIKQILERAKPPNFSNTFYTALGAISVNRLNEMSKCTSSSDDREKDNSPSHLDFPMQENSVNQKLRNNSQKKKIVATSTSPLVTSARPLTSDVNKPDTSIKEMSEMTICKDKAKFFNCPEFLQPLPVFPSPLQRLTPKNRLSNKVKLDAKRQATATSPLVTSARPLTSDVNKPDTGIKEKSEMTICKDKAKFFKCPEFLQPLPVFPSPLQRLTPKNRLSNKVKLDAKRQATATSPLVTSARPLTSDVNKPDTGIKEKSEMTICKDKAKFFKCPEFLQPLPVFPSPLQRLTPKSRLSNKVKLDAKRQATATSPLVTSARPLTSDVNKPDIGIKEKCEMTICKDKAKFFNCPALSEPLSVLPSTVQRLGPESHLSDKLNLDAKRQKLADTSDENDKSPVTSSSDLDSGKKKIKMQMNSSRLDFPIQENQDYKKIHSHSQKKTVTSPLVTSATALTSDVNKPDTGIKEKSKMAICKDTAKFFNCPELSQPLPVFTSPLQRLTPENRLSNKVKLDAKRPELADTSDKNDKSPSATSSSGVVSDKKKIKMQMNSSRLDFPIHENVEKQNLGNTSAKKKIVATATSPLVTPARPLTSDVNKPDTRIREESQMTNLKDKVKTATSPALPDTRASALERFKPAHQLSNSVELDAKRQKLDDTNDRKDRSGVTISSKAPDSDKKNSEIPMIPKPVVANLVDKLDRAYRIPKRVNPIQTEVSQKREIGVSWNDGLERNKVPVDPKTLVSAVKEINDNDVRKHPAEMVTCVDNSNVVEAFGPEIEPSETAHPAKATSNTTPVEKINYEDDDLDVLELCAEQDDFDLL